AVRLSHFLPFGVQSLLFGLSPVRFWPFVAATWLAMVPGTLLYTYLGSLAAAALGGEEGDPPGPGSWGLRLCTLAVIALALLYVIHFARRTLRQASRESAVAPVGWVESSRPTSETPSVGLEDSTHPTTYR